MQTVTLKTKDVPQMVDIPQCLDAITLGASETPTLTTARVTRSVRG